MAKSYRDQTSCKRDCLPHRRALTVVLALLFLVLPQMAMAVEIRLAWDSSPESDVAGYKVYYGAASRKYTCSIDVGNVTEATLSLPKKKYYISLTAYDIYGNESGFSNEVSWPIQVLQPDGGEVLHPNDSIWIQWGAASEAVSFTLAYSMDGGETWNTIREKVEGNSCRWTVPAPRGNKRKCLVRVVGYDASGKKVGSDKSNSPFTIKVVKVLSPNQNGEVLYSGETYPISWEVYGTKNPVTQVDLFYTKNGGTTWAWIDTLDGNPGYYSWRVPVVTRAKDQCRVKVILRDQDGKSLGADSSDGFFVIEP